MIGPKHSVASVAEDLAGGFSDGTITLDRRWEDRAIEPQQLFGPELEYAASGERKWPFENCDFDFLRRKWPFIASLILTTAGLVSLAIKGGPRYEIDLQGGVKMTVKFMQPPPDGPCHVWLGF